jgi:ferredoxin
MRPEVHAARLDALLESAARSGFRVDGVALARTLTDGKALRRLEQLVLNDASLAFLRDRAGRIEFIADGPLPPELLTEPALKTEPIYRQIVDYSLCKGCRLCIQICPKHVYTDDGFGKPDLRRRAEECTGDAQCAQCVDICPERSISLALVDPVYASTVFVLLENPFAAADAQAGGERDFFVANPLTTDRRVRIPGPLAEGDLAASNRILDAANFHPVLETMGCQRHFVDSADPVTELSVWARENSRSADLALGATRLLYSWLPRLSPVREGKYRLDRILHRIIDEVIHAGIEVTDGGGEELLGAIVADGFVEEPVLGSKRRPIGGLLPPGTSTAWKTPYGDEIPAYVHMQKCLGPECALCVTQCPEGNGGETSAIKLVPLVPWGTMASLVRGLKAFLLRLDGSHATTADLEDLSGKDPFVFEVNPDFCKACGICIACCPHDVIEPATRTFDMGGGRERD